MNIIATDPRDDFEKVFPLPKHVIRCGNGYACTEYNAWGAYEFIHKWEGWRAAKLGDGTLINEGTTAAPAVQAEQAEQELQNFRAAMEGIGHIRRTLEETFGGLHGTHCEPDVLVECKAICDAIYAAYRKTGNSPAIPDGWQIVPVDPTKDMLRAGQSVVGFWLNTVHCYAAMLAAAPKQEAE